MRLDPLDRRIVGLALPALGTLAVEPLYILTDTAIVGHLGVGPLGGLALASTVLTTVVWGCNFLSFGTTSRVAFLTGRGDQVGAAEAVVQGGWLVVLLGVPLAALVGLAGRPLAQVLGGEGAVLASAVTYLRISAVGLPFVLLAILGQGHLRGLSDTRTPFRVVLVANAVNVVLEVVLVYGFHAGVAGSAWGTVVAQALAGAWFLVLSLRRLRQGGNRSSPIWGTDPRPHPAAMLRLLVAGRQLFIRTAALVAALSLSTAVAGRIDAVTLGAHQITLQVYVFLALSLDSLAIPGQAMIGTHLGAGERDEARRVATRLMRLGLFAAIAAAAVVALVSVPLPYIFTSNHAVASRATVALLLAGLLQVPAGIAFTSDGILMGASDFAALQRGCVLALLVFVPLAAAVLHWPNLGIAGLWGALGIWMVVRAASNRARLATGAWLG